MEGKSTRRLFNWLGTRVWHALSSKSFAKYQDGGSREGGRIVCPGRNSKNFSDGCSRLANLCTGPKDVPDHGAVPARGNTHSFMQESFAEGIHNCYGRERLPAGNPTGGSA